MRNRMRKKRCERGFDVLGVALNMWHMVSSLPKMRHSAILMNHLGVQMWEDRGARGMVR